MLDTVALVMDSSMFAILNYDAFDPSARSLFQPPYARLGGRGSTKCRLNATRAELQSGKYYPRLTLTKRAVSGGFQITLRIEFSVPKLLYGNNFDEVRDDQFELVLETLKERLKEKGILLRRTKLEDVQLSKIDYSKNVVLEQFSSSRLILNELTKADMHLWLDLEAVKYRNAGYGIKYRNNGFELACYDKKKDLIKGKLSDKKSEEKDNAIQLDLLEKLEHRNSVEVFRIEARLNSRQKIRQIFKKLGIQAEPVFKDAFNSNYAQRVVQHFWVELEKGYKGLGYMPDTPSKLFTELAGRNPDKRLSVLLKAIGIKLILDELGVRGYRNLVSDFSDASWANSRKTINSLNIPQTYWSPLAQISKSIEEFKPVKLEDYNEITV